LGAYAHQGIPFEKVVVATGASREMSRSPIYQIVLTMQNAPFEQLQLSGLSVEPIEQAVDAAPVDVTFSISEENNVIKGSVEYAEFIGAGVIRRLVEHYRRALEEMVRDPEQRISRIEFLTQAERRQLLEEWNQTDEAFPLERGYSQLFEEQARKTPDRIAVACGDRRLTYRELNERANRLARILAREGVGPEKVVALLSERRIELLVAILGVFKAGGAYLPLDPHHPPARIRQLVEQSRPALILASDALAADLERTISTFDPEARPRTLGLNPGSDQEVGAENLPPLAGPNNLAYVIYTSGSTGAPKGAMVEQVGMINHLYAKLAELRLGENDVVAQTASQCFDISVWQFLAALLVGGRVQIFDDDLTHDPSALLRQIERESVTVVEVVPSLLRAMLEGATVGEAAVHGLAALRCMMVTGEALPPELASWWLRIYPRVPMLNAYGPTECSDDVTHKVITTPPAEGAPRVPIGKPISNMRMYTLDEVGSPAPIGVAGELHVGGIGVGRGYLDDPSRTAQSFVPDPFSGRPGERLYKTGDSVRYRSDGDLEFLGRIDEQVKIRGFRIELGEIEAALAQHPNVKQAVVIAREDGLGDKRLLAYVVPAEPGGEAQSAGHAVSVPQLQNYLREKLPEYMTPGTFVLLDSLPQTRNGKIDRRALSEVAPAEPEREIAYQPARTHTEEVLSGFWKQSLGGGRFGVREKFFDVGGDSLKLVRVFRLLNERYPDTVTVIDMFKYNTIEALATYIDAKRPVRAEAPALQGFEL
jgi:amino acid adenylation domain-containing protein